MKEDNSSLRLSYQQKEVDQSFKNQLNQNISDPKNQIDEAEEDEKFDPKIAIEIEKEIEIAIEKRKQCIIDVCFIFDRINFKLLK